MVTIHLLCPVSDTVHVFVLLIGGTNKLQAKNNLVVESNPNLHTVFITWSICKFIIWARASLLHVHLPHLKTFHILPWASSSL